MSLSADDIKSLLAETDSLRVRAQAMPEVSLGCGRAQAQLQQLIVVIPADAGGAAAGTWAALPQADRDAIETQLTSLSNELDALTNPSSLMSSRLAPTWMVFLLLLVAMGGIVLTLSRIAGIWEDALQGQRSPTEGQAVYNITRQQAEDATRVRLKIDGDLATKRAELDQTRAAQGTDNAAIALAENVVSQLDQQQKVASAVEKKAWSEAGDAEQMLGPRDRTVLIAVMLFGTLGGLLHLASSLTMFVGNRDLRRSWLIYYLMAPLQGAALAPLIFLLTKSAILAPQLTQSTQSLNLTGIYALAGLTGLFAKQAIEKLADLWATFFTRVRADDPTKTGAGQRA